MSNSDLARIREQLFGIHLLMLQGLRSLTEADRQLDAIKAHLDARDWYPLDESTVRTVADCVPVIPSRLAIDGDNPEGPQG